MKLNGCLGNIWTPVFGQISLRNATINIKDGAENSISVTIGEGNLTYTERKTIEYTLDRGVIDEVREGDDVPIEVRLDFTWTYLRGPSSASTAVGGTPTVEDALKQVGAAASWTSSDSDTCRPYAVDLEIINAPSPTACGDKETITLPDFRYEDLDHDLRAGTVAVTGRCNTKVATIVRAAQ